MATPQTANNQKNDIFVGNLAFNTTEEQLHQAFSEIGRVINVRLVTDVETGKPRGFAFVEFEEAQAALSAIRNMKDYELNGRRLRVNFSNSSHLEVLATKLGMDLTSSSAQSRPQQTQQQPTSTGTSAVAESLKNMGKAQMYDVVAKLKEIAERDSDEARRLLSGHPQLPEAMLYLMGQLDMVKTPLPSELTATVAAPVIAPAPAQSDPRKANAGASRDPRQAVSDPRMANNPAVPAPPRVDPRAADPRAAADPRQRMDPRSRPAPVPVAPPVSPAFAGGIPPGIGHLDPNLVQQVMSLSDQQIQLLPPDKRHNILELRQQIARGR